ncbi:MAG: hypothetical protein R3E62_10000 [Pseudomonadales bacterium]
MNKIVPVISLFLILVFSPLSHALQGQGKVEEIKICGTGSSSYGWYNYVFFKLSDGNWFGIYGNNENRNAEMNFNHSVLLTAFSMGLDVEVKANYGVVTACDTTVEMMFNNAVDILRVVRP